MVWCDGVACAGDDYYASHVHVFCTCMSVHWLETEVWCGGHKCNSMKSEDDVVEGWY